MPRLGIIDAMICSRDGEGDGIDVDPLEENDTNIIVK